ncbi:D-alanyl-D-alanine carboxypeptidase/D-alanyl-D-alanine-endopeptidase [Jannaschia sp. LMIT008]|uniref:D-alanyl-D-alanine carboxypeptidase/D-alanyl-D-alanine endopeptidase n=1 Tax=Jannaschia maritima TaxID=3032585 RepID=UPI002811838A|nr:D-alanyl-D-alanine carboxypeptidase/D-alanyl-D-alanine-endopeptidase [Jannaschia sp. LMIT008]
MKRRTFLGGALALGAVGRADAFEVLARSARPPRKPEDALARGAPAASDLIAAAGLGGHVSAVVADARTGAVLEAVNPLRALPPASVLKAVTALYAIETLGPDHAFRTRLCATGPVEGGVLRGDLALLGGGDPSLDTDGLYAMAAAAKAAGVTAIEGELLVSPGPQPTLPRIDPAQPPHVGYNPAVSGLNLNFNRVHFGWERRDGDYRVTMDARTERFRPDVASARMAVADRSLPVYTYASDGAVDRWTVARAQLGGAGARWLPVRNPLVYAGDVMRTMLRSHGIAVGPARVVADAPAGRVVAEQDGAPLARVAAGMLRYSTNITAECLGLAATRARGGSTVTLAASGDAMAGWLGARAGVGRAAFDDHSGLNGTSRLSASDMVRVLCAPEAERVLRPILRDRVVQEGREPFMAVAKTGTLNFASGLAGYFDARSGRTLAFAVFAADPPRREALPVGERERPAGGQAWGLRARNLQHELMARWWDVHA